MSTPDEMRRNALRALRLRLAVQLTVYGLVIAVAVAWLVWG
ncbi:hypothetical protein [Actinomadura luzonensis]|nr:hypothetical protein [Actinomadura luzonensis]